MKAFEFSLRSLLDAKIALEQAAEARLGKAGRELVAQRDKFACLREQRIRQIGWFEEIVKGGTQRDELCVHMAYLNRLEQHMREQEDMIEQCERDVDNIRGDLLVLARERKSLENMKARERRTWLFSKKRMELKEMDEIAMAGFIRRRTA